MLETEMQKLVSAISALTESVDKQTAVLERFEAVSKEAGRKSLADRAAKWEAEGFKVPEDIKAKIEDKPTPVADPEPKAKAKVKAEPAPEPEAEPVPSNVSRDDLQAKCMSIVRADRKKRASVEAIIAEYGATLIRDVPEDKLAELAAKLNELESL